MKKNMRIAWLLPSCIVLTLLTLYTAVLPLQAQDTTTKWYLYVVPLDEEIKPLAQDTFYTGNDSLNILFDHFHVSQYTRSFPGAKTLLLDSMYEIHASGDIDSLKYALEGTGYFSSVEKADYYFVDCQNPHPALSDAYASAQYALEMIEARCAWSITKGNPDVIVAVVDSEFDTDHDDLEGQIVSVWGSTTAPPGCEHGTGVTGCVAALTHNEIGVGSIGYKIRAAGYQVHNMEYDEKRKTFTANVWPAIWQAYLEGRKIINVSYGGIGNNGQYPNLPTPNRLVVEEMTEHGVVLVVSAGNDHRRVSHRIYANVPGVIVVSGVGDSNKHGDTYRRSLVDTNIWIYHAHNEYVDLCAPSMAIYGIHPGNNYGNHWGTSYAAPIVAGTVGLMLSVNPCLSPGEIEEILKATTDPIADAHNFPGLLGTGRLNAYRAVEMALEYRCLEIVKVGINTKCRPGESTNSLDPKLTPVIANGTPPYTYKWDPIMDGDPNGNNTTLDFDNIAEPTIVASSNNHLAYYRLTVTDASTIQKRATRIVRFQLQSSGYDLAMRDSDVDLFDEPNMQASLDPTQWNVWLSPDVWNQLDDSYITGHQDPLYSTTDPNYAYVRVKNVGCAPSPANVPLKLYWALASTGEEWPRDWVGNSQINTIPAGGIITTTPLSIPSLDPGEEYVDNHEWYPRDPQLYDPRVHTLDVCLLARIEEGITPPYGMTFPEGRSTTENVRNNNNIVTRNMNMYNLGRDGSRQVVVSNTGITEQAFSIEFITEEVLRGGISGHLADYLDATIYLGEDLYDIWQNGGGSGSFIPGSSEQYTVKWDPSTPFRLDNIVLDTAVRFPVRITLHAKYDTEIPDSLIGQLVHFRQLVLDTLGGYEVYGNVTYSIDFRPNDPAPKGVLFVTEIGNGPSSATNCEYKEIMVANCGNDQSDFVDIRGWILDDDVDNFGTSGCNAGHYRISYDSLWSKVPVGSILALYNTDVNCYLLPDTFTITKDGAYTTYWIPIGRYDPEFHPYLEATMEMPYIQYAYGVESYCWDYYVPYESIGWFPFLLHNAGDAFQVRCPGCTDYYDIPAFYHGIGYGVSASNSIPPDYASLGGPVIDGSGDGYRYIFAGNTETDLGDTSAWLRMISQPGGSPVGTLGYVGAFHQKVLDHELNLPCCGAEPPLRRAPEQDGTIESKGNNTFVPQEVHVYPNPARETLHFLFPSGDVTIKLTDISGRIADVQVIKNDVKAVFDVRQYTPGIYLYQVITKDGVHSGRVMIGQ